MDVKHIYFIRHGQTLANRKYIHQGPKEPLSLEGRMQAEHVANFMRDKQIDTLISSPYVRAQETAAFVSEALQLPIITQECVKEFRRPNYLYNKGHFTFGAFLYLWNLFRHQENPNWDNDGAENMYMARKRVLEAKDMIANLEGERIAIVSHSIFMNMFMELVCREKKLTMIRFLHGLFALKKTPNTGIIHMTYSNNPPVGTCACQLIEFIDPRVK